MHDGVDLYVVTRSWLCLHCESEIAPDYIFIYRLIGIDHIFKCAKILNATVIVYWNSCGFITVSYLILMSYMQHFPFVVSSLDLSQRVRREVLAC